MRDKQRRVDGRCISTCRSSGVQLIQRANRGATLIGGSADSGFRAVFALVVAGIAIGRANVFRAQPKLGAALFDAYAAAGNWLATPG